MNLPNPTDSIALADGPNGEINVRLDYIEPRLVGPAYCQGVLAVALTEHCCERRSGKVYYVHVATHVTEWNSKEEARYRVPREVAMLPQLLYVAERWSESERKVWLELSQEGRLRRLNARCPGALSIHAIVMPIALYYDGCRWNDEEVWVNGFLNGTAGPLVALSIPDRAYLGWIPVVASQAEYRQGLETPSAVEHGRVRDPVWVVTGGLRALMQQTGIDAILSKLESMRREARKQSLVELETVLGWIKGAYDQWVTAAGEGEGPAPIRRGRQPAGPPFQARSEKCGNCLWYCLVCDGNRPCGGCQKKNRPCRDAHREEAKASEQSVSD